jgi:hypothetical protein
METWENNQIIIPLERRQIPLKGFFTLSKGFLSRNFCLSLLKMKTLSSIIGWVLFSLILACLFLSLSYRFDEALFIAILYLPGIFALRYMTPQLPTRTMQESEWDEDEGPVIARKPMAYAGLFLAIILLEELLVFLAHLIVLAPPENPLAVSTPVLLYNPVLAIVLLGAGYAWGMLLDRAATRWLPKEESTIDFVSDRQKVSVQIASILYIESRDTEVYVHLTDGTAYRNKTPISHWESILGCGFLRVHRAYLVNATRIKSTTQDALYVDDARIPVSRKYRDALKGIHTEHEALT